MALRAAVKECARKGIPEHDTRETLNKLYDIAQMPVHARSSWESLWRKLCVMWGTLALSLLSVREVTEQRLPELRPRSPR